MVGQYSTAIKTELTRLIETFNLEEKYVKAITAISTTGLPLCSIILDKKLDENQVSALMSTAFTTADRINVELGHGDSKLIFIQGEIGDFLMITCGTGVIAIIFDHPVYLAQLFLQDLQMIQELCEKLAPLFVGGD